MIKEILENLNEAKSILSNDIKKGWEIETRAGCMAIIQNSKKGNIREIKTTTENGCYAEFGTVYAWDIVKARENSKSPWMSIELTPKQEKSKSSVRVMGF